jgi:hypothetical protein
MLRPDDQPALVLTTDFFTAQVGALRGVLPVQGMVVRFPEQRRIRRSAATSVINLLAAPELPHLCAETACCSPNVSYKDSAGRELDA